MLATKMNMNIIEQINSHEVLFLQKIEEVEINTLRIIIVEGISGGNKESIAIDGEIIEDLYSITSGNNHYEIIFKNYIAYSVRNESYTVWNKEEKFNGRLFRFYTKSNFIDYVNNSTIKVSDKDRLHYGIICGDHIIDIVVEEEPTVTILNEK